MDIKRVRMLLRVSSNQQLDADGDLTIQRQLIVDYIKRHENWILDSKEYFEGSNSGYKNSVSDRNILTEIYEDAEKDEFDYLVAYKDDRLGRRMWEIGAYVMRLKSIGIDIYTVKDGCISPNTDDIMGQMVLALRYGNAQKSSSDTGMRVKDTAQKLVQKGKFMGGKAPYGYELQLSGEISKHGRALKRLSVIPEQAEIVKRIFQLSQSKEYGSAKIARILNDNERYKALAPNDFWKAGTITSILTNPVYAGRTAYKRREKINGEIHRLKIDDWVVSDSVDSDMQIIEEDVWNSVQRSRERRNHRYIRPITEKDVTIIKNNSGVLPLIDVLHCGYCGKKFVNGNKYNYWTIKGTGEKRVKKIAIYRCQTAQQGIPHDKTKQFRADLIEPIIFEQIIGQLENMQENDTILSEISNNHNKEKNRMAGEVKAKEKEILKLSSQIEVMEDKIPDAMTGEYALSLDELAAAIKKHKEKLSASILEVDALKGAIERSRISADEVEQIRKQIPEWKDVFRGADSDTKRVLIDKIVKRIDITKERIVIEFKINMDYFKKQH